MKPTCLFLVAALALFAIGCGEMENYGLALEPGNKVVHYSVSGMT